MKKTIRVYLLTGFLGSGKTTLLRRLLEASAAGGYKAAVLMNESGDVNLDGFAVDASVPMAELLGGCICCTIKSDVGMELLDLAKKHEPDIVFVEATGLAQPFEIIDAVSEASMYARLELRGVIAVVDAAHLLDRVRIGSGKTLKLMREQIRAASLLLINKADLIRREDLEELAATVRGWNPTASIAPCVRCEADLSFLRDDAGTEGALKLPPKPAEEEPAEAADAAPRFKMAGGPSGGHDHVHVVTHYLPGAVDSRRFEQFLAELPDGIYRAKGIVTFTDTASRFLFQFAYKESDFMRITPQKTVHDVAVFIGEGFSRSELLNRLERLFQADSASEKRAEEGAEG